MPFPFSFVFSVPGIANPFSSHESLHSPGSPTSPVTPGIKKPKLGMNGKLFTSIRAVKTDPLRRRPPTPSLEPTQPTSRKRGWVPSSSEPSIPTTVQTTVQTSTSGHLSATSQDPAMPQATEQSTQDEMEADLPPPKRRKTIAGSLVSTALSAALIGTAVGLTVYRIWKGKGKEGEAPPPYEPGEWVGPSDADANKPNYIPQPDPSEQHESNITSPSMRHRRQRHVAGRRTAPRHRKVQTRTQQTYAHTINFAPPQAGHSPIPPEFNFGSPDHEDEPEEDDADQMDWIGDRLARLIEEGKRALGKEIVVMSEAKEDEEDDGSGQWVEDDEMHLSASSSASFRKGRSKRPANISVSSPPPQYTSPQTTPRTPQKNRFSSGHSRPGSVFSSPGGRSRADSVDSAHSFAASSHHEDEATMSAELRESMERARMLYLQRRQMS